MADESKQCDENLFKGLRRLGKEFILPNISSPWLLEDFVLHHNVSDQIELESYPTAILDDSCVTEVMSKPSIPLVESVEAFFWGHIETPFGSSIKPTIDVPISETESHDLQPVKEEQGHVYPRSFPGSDHSQNVDGHGEDLQISSKIPQPCLLNEGFPVSARLVSPDVKCFLPVSSVNLAETYSCSFCATSFATVCTFQGHQAACAESVKGKEPEKDGVANNLDGNPSKMLIN